MRHQQHVLELLAPAATAAGPRLNGRLEFKITCRRLAGHVAVGCRTQA